jgi:[ribosomal protein S5]-alanine N-acetyltransferase
MIPTLQTPRLILRPFHPGDAADVQRLAGNRAIADTTLAIPHPYLDGMAEAWIAMHEPEFAEGTGAAFAITECSNGNLVGAISLMRIQNNHMAELGYWIGEPFWKQGFCTEAAGAVLDYAFPAFRLIRIHARHLRRNPASGRVMQKLGMKPEGRLRRHIRKWEVFEDVELYGILREEWAGAGQPPGAG